MGSDNSTSLARPGGGRRGGREAGTRSGEAGRPGLCLSEGPDGMLEEKEDVKDGRGQDRKSTRLNSSHSAKSRMPSSA